MKGLSSRIKWSLILTLVAILAAGIVAGTTNAEDPLLFLPLILNPPAEIPPESLATEQFVAGRINEHRASFNMYEYSQATELTQAARQHSNDMAANGFTGHTGSDGSSPAQRIAAAGYDALASGEIIGWGFGGDSRAVIAWWMNSPIHRSLILSDNFEQIGVGYTQEANSDYTHYWTVTFGLPRSADKPAITDKLYRCTDWKIGDSGGSSILYYSAKPCP